MKEVKKVKGSTKNQLSSCGSVFFDHRKDLHAEVLYPSKFVGANQNAFSRPDFHSGQSIFIDCRRLSTDDPKSTASFARVFKSGGCSE